MVPMVTTIDGKPSPVTRMPLKAPQTIPVAIPIRTSPSVPTPICTAAPIAVEASAMIDATTSKSRLSQLFSFRSSGDCRRSGMLRVVMWRAPLS